MDDMRIAQLAERSGVPPSTLRYYGERGLLPARRSPAGYRLYDRGALDRLAFIAAGKRLGLDLDEIGGLLRVWRDGACTRVRESLRPRIAARLDTARARAEELAGFARVLRGALAHLDALPDRDGPCGPECGLLDLGRQASGGSGEPEAPTRSELPVAVPATGSAIAPEAPSAALAAACALDGGAARERIGRWRELLRGAPREEAPGGFRAALPADRAAEAAELAAAEVRCCAFFTFSLEFDRTGTALRVSAPEQARPMLDEVFGAPEPAAPPAPPGKTCACSR
ncbi:MerR family transcriptional regulator [Nocardiopsis composta]|uniref:DNA-binding transcriptional MerR regulator n=1 Tax=Nocardiopsis composta TaxID=157465 RepID=A0A7W8QL93_9ACTN|nr:MerR family transcriptional regulator [Nocardiopsis composta]MBB5432532.1 DNA-binding transcriptional MerR regulator [Nocardiopsis composta]